jgi:PAS domain S-box-containing protein
MKIATRLRLAAFVPLLMALLVVGTLVYSLQELEKIRSAGDTLGRVRSCVTELNHIVFSYALYHEERPREQFLVEYDELISLIDASRVQNSAQKELLQDIRSGSESMNSLFSQMVAIYDSDPANMETVHEAGERLAGLLLLQAYEVDTNAAQLRTLIDGGIRTTEVTALATIFAVMVLAAVPLTIILLRTRSGVIDSLGRLAGGAAIIGSGNLDYKIEDAGTDEIADLSRAFNGMTSSLKEVTASKMDLQREIEERERTQQALGQSEEKYRTLFSCMSEGFALHEIILDSAGRPCDYRFLEINDAFEKLTGLSRESITGKTVKDVMPDTESYWIDVYGRVALTGEPARFENFSAVLDRWYGIFAYSPAANRFAVLFSDITARKKIEIALQASEQRWATTLASIGDGVIATDAGGCITFMNSVAGELTGWNLDEAEGQPVENVFNIINEFTREKTENPVLKVLKEGGIVGLANHTILIKKNGVEVPIDDSGAPIRDFDGITRGVVLVFRDISQRSKVEAEKARYLENLKANQAELERQAEELKRVGAELRESEERFRIMADSSPLILWAHDADGTLKFTNKAYREYFGVTSEQLESSGWQPFVHPEDVTNYTDKFIVSIKEKQPFQAEARVRRADGEWRWVESFGSPRFSPSGKFLGMVGSSPDVTERKKAEQLKDEFIGMVSHEIRTPLTILMGAIGTAMSEGINPEDTRSMLEEAMAGAESLNQIVNNLIELSRYQSSRLTLQKESVDVSEFISNIIEKVQPSFSGHLVTAELTDSLPPVMADKIRLGLIIGNLLSNAAKYSPEGTQIHISAREMDGALAISVTDEGIGVPPAKLGDLFRPFERLDSGKHPPSGLGLGLLVCKRLAEAHGGSIWVESTPGQGSTFSFTLPL